MGQLCDDGCKVVLDQHDLAVVKNKTVILRGKRNKTDGLWDIPIVKRHLNNGNFQLPQTHAALYTVQQQQRVSHITRPKQRGQQSCKQHTIKNNSNVNNISYQHCVNLVSAQLKQDITNAERYQTATIFKKEQKLAVIIRKKETRRDLVRYLHAACFSPVTSTWEKAIRKNFFQTWPALTQKLVTRHLPRSEATVQGHIHKQKQNLQSTRRDGTPTLAIVQRSVPEDMHPASPTPNTREHRVAYGVVNKEELVTAYKDLTGRFPIRSTAGNEYILVGYHYDANCILGYPVKNRTGPVLTTAWKHLQEQFTKAGLAPDVWILDNEISKELTDAFDKDNTKYQLVPPHSHRRNLAERAIQTWKNHFKAGLATTDPKFPLTAWDLLIPQANITLNLLRSARTNPTLSAYAYVFGNFDFTATPLAPPGTKVIVHRDAAVRGTWDLNGEQGWYVGPAPNHYRCVKCYFPKTRSTRVCETVTFFPHEIPFPQVRLQDHLKQAAEDIITILTQPPKNTVPSLRAGDPVRNALLDIAAQLKRVDDIPAQTTDSTPTPTLENPTPANNTPRNQNARLPRVVTPEHQTTEVLREHSTTPRRLRFQNSPTHKYSLRSQTNTGTNFRHLAAQQLVAEHMFQPHANHIYRPDGKKETIDTLLRGSDRVIWTQSLSNEWGRLAQGNDAGVVSTNTIDFVHQHEVPKDRDVTYATFVLDYRPLKTEPYRVRITVGGDRLTYTSDAGSPAANLLETKLLVNSTISDANKGARFMSADLKDFFLATPMDGEEFMKVHYKHFPADIRERYKLDQKVTDNGCIYIKIKRGMYGLKQAAVLAYRELKKNLATHGYHPITGTVGLWQHETRPTKFCVCVDDFGVKYYTKEDANHLITSLREHYKCTTDWEGKNYCGLTFNWQYDKGYVDVSMPKYVPDSLTRLGHIPKTSPQYSPHEHVPIKYGRPGQQQYATTPDQSTLLSPQDTKHIQSTTGSFLYYGRAIDYTILPALNDISSMQAHPTERTQQKAERLMDYLHTYPDAYIRYYASDMVLHVDSDAAYLVAPKARSRIAGYFHMSDHPNVSKRPKLNGAVLVECKTLRHVVSSSAEAEVAGIFHNATTAIPIRHILTVLGHPQPPTPLKTDNSTATGFVYDNIHQKRSKAWDMRYHWLRDRLTQQQFNIFWEKGVTNDADYFTKHHATSHHRAQRAKYVRDKLKECLNLLSLARVC